MSSLPQLGFRIIVKTGTNFQLKLTAAHLTAVHVQLYRNIYVHVVYQIKALFQGNVMKLIEI